MEYNSSEVLAHRVEVVVDNFSKSLRFLQPFVGLLSLSVQPVSVLIVE